MKISTEYYSKFENIEKSNKLVVDDIVDVHGIIYSDHDDLIIANIQDGVLKLRLLSYTFEELKTKISILSFAEYLPWWENCINIEINFQKTVLADPPLVLMFLTYDSKAWTSNFTIHLLSEQFKKVVELNINKRIGFIPWGIDETNGFGMSYKGIEKGNVWFTLEGALDILKECLDEALVYFQENSKFITENSLGTLFSFPSHLKTASIQYLIYFGQFLSDLGIEAETEIKEEAHKTLFTVHPKDKAESLLNIKNAFSSAEKPSAIVIM